MTGRANRILVIGGTGNVGRQVVHQLRAAEAQFRVMTRDSDVAGLPPQVEVVRGDLTVPETLDPRAIRGVVVEARRQGNVLLLSDTSSLTDFGMIFGAMAAASFSRPFARNAWPPLASLAAAATGGLLMGWGARLGFGCNIGAFVGGVASGSLHGWVWFACALGGCTVGIRLRPLFGLSRE